MEKLKLTKHNFTLEQDEYDFLCWRASEELRTVNNALRMSLRELYNKNRAAVTAWKMRTGRPVSQDDEVDVLMGVSGNTDDADELIARYEQETGVPR